MWVPFKDLSIDSRVWIFQSNRILSNSECNDIDQELKSFLRKWSSHGKQIYASHTIVHECFIILAADEQKQKVSGCSIDSLSLLFKYFGQNYKLSFFDRFIVAYKKNTEVCLISLNRFKVAINSGELDGESIVFNNLASSKSDLSSFWEIKIKDSWLKRYL